MTSGFIEVTKRTEEETILINIDHIIAMKPAIWKKEEKEIGTNIALTCAQDCYLLQVKEKYNDIKKLMDDAMHRVLAAAVIDASGTDYKRIVK
jgi:hypothetical protein